MAVNITDLNNRLWAAADQLRANSKLKSSEYAVSFWGSSSSDTPTNQRFQKVREELTMRAQETGSRRGIGKPDYHACGVLYLPEQARFSYLLNLPEDEDLGKAINEAMKAVEVLNADARELEGRIAENVAGVLETAKLSDG